MIEREDKKPLAGLVQVDDVYLGGVRNGKRGRGAEGKAPFVAAARTLPCRDEWIGWSAAETSARTRVILFPGTSRGNPGDSLAWNKRRRDHEINLAVRLFAALGVPQLERRGRIVRIFRLGRANAKRVEAESFLPFLDQKAAEAWNRAVEAAIRAFVKRALVD